MNEYDRLYSRYENCKDEELEEIANGGFEFTQDAKRAARDILKARRGSLKQDDHDVASAENPSATQEQYKKDSVVGSLIKMIAIVFFVVAALVIVISASRIGLLWCVVSLFVAFASNLLIYGLGEVICLLTSIDAKITKE